MLLVSYRPGGRRVLLAAVSSLAGAFFMCLAPAATASVSSAAAHQVHCVLIGGRLYLGSPGAGTNPEPVICAIHFDQVRPRSDGVIVVLQHARQTSTYSILRMRLGHAKR